MRLSPDGTVESSIVLATLTARGTTIRPGATRNVRLDVTLASDPVPALLPGQTYTVIARVAGTGQVLTTIPWTIPASRNRSPPRRSSLAKQVCVAASFAPLKNRRRR